MHPAAQSHKHRGGMGKVARFPHAQGMLIGIAEHGVGNNDERVIGFGNRFGFPETHRQNLLLNCS